MERVRLLVALCCVAFAGCRESRPTTLALVDATGRHALPAEAPRGRQSLDVVLAGPTGGRVRLVGVTAPAEPPLRGIRAAFTLYVLVEEPPAQGAPLLFVHAAAPGAEVNQANADHQVVGGAVPPRQWQRGDLLVDRFTVAIPADLGVDELVVYAGLYEGKDRWRATGSVVDNRVEIARMHVASAPPLALSADIHRRVAPIQLDGVLDEPDWQRATVLGPFVSWDGKSAIERKTAARLVWDAQNLYLAFEADDPDPLTPYTQRDDPLYESEALEIFIDADGDRDEYVELQSAPNDVHFDAAFSGGRRKNMDKGYQVPFATKTRFDGARVVSEWRIPIAEIKDVPPGEPRVGASWRINLFRLERVRAKDAGGVAKVVRNEASAWSSPLSGDFHNLDRFGTIRFTE